MSEIKLTKINKELSNGYYAGKVIAGAVFVNGTAAGIVGKRHIGDPLVNRRSGEVFVEVTEKNGKPAIYISEPEHPTSEEFMEMKAICIANRWTMPVYDRRAYAGVKRWLASHAVAAVAAK